MKNTRVTHSCRSPTPSTSLPRKQKSMKVRSRSTMSKRTTKQYLSYQTCLAVKVLLWCCRYYIKGILIDALIPVTNSLFLVLYVLQSFFGFLHATLSFLYLHSFYCWQKKKATNQMELKSVRFMALLVLFLLVLLPYQSQQLFTHFANELLFLGSTVTKDDLHLVLVV